MYTYEEILEAAAQGTRNAIEHADTLSEKDIVAVWKDTVVTTLLQLASGCFFTLGLIVAYILKHRRP